jgi:protoheme IX farnesyltransferase
VLSIAALICIAVGAGASGALNMWYDADIDAAMTRTAGRPIPRGRISPDEALVFGVVLAAGSVICLGLMVNWAAAALLALTIVFYVVVYTMWLKRSTPQNIVIGGAAGAAPPLLGWTAVTGSIEPGALLLFLIIFAWTPPHFWALAIHRRDEYARAGIPMLPVTHGVSFTRLQILLYTVLLTAITLLPVAIGMSGYVYLAGALLLDARFLWLAWGLWWGEDDRLAMPTFVYSITYLAGLFTLLLVDRFLGLAGP